MRPRVDGFWGSEYARRLMDSSAGIRTAMQRTGMHEGWAEGLQSLASLLLQWQSSLPA